MRQDQPDNLDAYLDLGAEDIARLVLCLLVEEMLRERLAAFRQGLPLRPAGDLNEIACAGNIVPLFSAAHGQ